MLGQEIKLGAIKFVDFDAANGPAEAKKAWAGVKPQTGATFKPICYCAEGPCKGTNYWFLAQETVIGNPGSTRIVVLAINGFNGQYAIIPSSIREVKFEI